MSGHARQPNVPAMAWATVTPNVDRLCSREIDAKAHALVDEAAAADWSSEKVRPRGASRTGGEARRGEAER
jgi:hypothetical protein